MPGFLKASPSQKSEQWSSSHLHITWVTTCYKKPSNFYPTVFQQCQTIVQAMQQQLKMKCLTGELPMANEAPAMEQTTPAHISKILSTQVLYSNYWASSNPSSPKMDSVLSYCLPAFSVSRMPDLWSWEDNLLNYSQSFEMQSKDRYIFDLSLLTSHSDYLIIHYSLALPQCQVLICFILHSSYLSFSLQTYYSDIFKWK